MEFILTDDSGIDTRFVPDNMAIDIDVGTDNDLQVSIALDDADVITSGGYIYCDGEEYGGDLQNPEINTSEDTVTYEGTTFRGMLDQRFVLVPAGEDYRIVSGDLDEIVQTLIEEQFDSLFEYIPSNSGITITSYQLPRYYSLLASIERILDDNGKRLKIAADGSGTTLSVKLSIEDVTDLSETVETSQDSGFNFKIKKQTKNINYCLALGSGNLKDRTVKMYQYSDGELTEVSEFPKNVVIEKYDLSNAESDDDLESQTLTHMKELNSESSQEMTIPDNLDLKIGDIIGARDYITGTYIKTSVTGMIIKQSAGDTTITYKVGD